VSGTAQRVTSRPGDGDELTAMLLRVEDVRHIVGAPDLEISETYDKFLDYLEFSPEVCAGVPFNTIERAYRSSGYQVVRGMTMQTSEEIPAHWVDEGVVRFATADDARRFVTDAEPVWREYAGTQARAVPDEDTGPQIWAIGDTVNLPDTDGLVVRSSRVDAAGDECSHAMADKADLVIDVAVCGRRVTDDAVTILHRIASRPPV
jgi:serine/threonine kinase PknH